MTRIKRKKANSPVRFVRAMILVVAVLALALTLFQLDQGFGRGRNKKLLRAPDAVVLQNQLAAASSSSSSSSSSADKGTALVNNSTHQYAVLTLGGLKPTPTDSSSSTVATVLVELRHDWAPIGVNHLVHTLLSAQYYTDARFFRVLPNFVVQFGIAADPVVTKRFLSQKLKDDPVQSSNVRGTLTYATSGPNTRTTQLFINKGNNKALDKQGFSPIGRVWGDLSPIDRIVDEYREKPGQGRITQQGNEYLRKEFPRLSFVQEFRIATATEIATLSSSLS